MVKNKMVYALTATTLVLGTGLAVPFFAEDAFAESVTINDYESLNANLCKGGDLVLTADINVDNWLATDCDWIINKDTTIDFNGHTITSAANRGYNIDFQDANLTFKDSVGGGGYTQLGENNIAIAITNGKFVLDGGTINATTWGVVLWHDSEFEMNGGSIIADNLAISGNGVTDPEHKNYGSNVEITINDGTIESKNDWAIYNPSENSIVNIHGGSITGGSGAIAANRGTINIDGGELKSLGTATVEGDVSQDGTRGYENAVIGIPKEYGPVDLNISGGTFLNENGASLIADVSGLDNENKATVEISGGVFSVEPEQSEIADGYEADVNEEGTGYAIYPKEIDMRENGEMMSDDSLAGAVAGSAVFTKEFNADRKATFEISTLDTVEFEALKVGEAGGDLVAGFDVSLWNRDNEVIEVSGTEIKVKIALSEEQYQALSAYDRVVAINFDAQGNEVERFNATLTSVDNEYFVEFTTTHLSTYGIAGVNGAEEEATTTDTTTPETGTVTAAGASAISAALITAVAAGLLVAIITFAFFIRRI